MRTAARAMLGLLCASLPVLVDAALADQPVTDGGGTGRIEVRVRDAHGKAVGNLKVGRRRPGEKAWLASFTGEDGLVVFAAVGLGDWNVKTLGNVVVGDPACCIEERVTVDRADMIVDVNLVVDSARLLRIEIPGGEGRANCDSGAARNHVMLVHVLRGDRELAWCGEESSGRTTDILCVPSGREVDLLVQANSGMECAFVEKVMPGSAVTRVVLSEGRRVSGRVDPPGVVGYVRAVYRGAVIGMSVDEEGRFESAGLPKDISVTIEGEAIREGRLVGGKVKVNSGDRDVKLVLQER